MLKGFWADKNKRNLLIVFIIIALLVLVLIGFMIAQQVIRKNSDRSSQTNEEVDLVSWPDEMLITISRLGVKGYLAETDKQIESITSSEEKAYIYKKRAFDLYKEMEKGEDLSKLILADVYKAEEINPTIDSAYNIYYFEDKIGSKEKANEYLRIAEERGFDKKKGRG